MHPELRDYEWKCYPLTLAIPLAKQLFKEQYKIEPLTAITWGQWLYVGPIPDKTKEFAEAPRNNP